MEFLRVAQALVSFIMRHLSFTDTPWARYKLLDRSNEHSQLIPRLFVEVLLE